jgi:hypothetical protein
MGVKIPKEKNSIGFFSSMGFFIGLLIGVKIPSKFVIQGEIS